MAANRTLELTLISAKDLKDVNLLSKMDVYAEVSLSGDHRSRQRTKTDVDSGKNPNWNQTLKFTVPADAGAPGTLNIIVRAEKALGDRDIGEIHIPFKELLATVSGDGPTPVQFISHQLRSSTSGKTRGIINMSYKLSERVASQAAAPAGYPPVTIGNKTDSPFTAYPPANAYPPPGSPYPQPFSGYPVPTKKPWKNSESTPPPNAYPPPGAPYTGYPATSEKPWKNSESTPPPNAYLPPGAPYTGYPATTSEKPSKSSEPVTAYPAGSSSAPAYPAPPQYGYGAPPPQYGAPPPPYGYAQPPPQYGYAPPQQGYGYPASQKPAKNKKNKFGMGLGAGLLGGAIGGLILGDVVDDVYDSGFDAGYDDGGFDF